MNTRGRLRSDVYDGAIKKSGSPLLRRNISRTAVLEDPTFGTGSALLCDQVGLLNVNVRWRSRRRPRPRAGAPAALKNFVGQPENTFSTVSARNGHADCPARSPLSRTVRKTYARRELFRFWPRLCENVREQRMRRIVFSLVPLRP